MKFIAVNYPIKFIESVIRAFRQKDNNVDTGEYIIFIYQYLFIWSSKISDFIWDTFLS